MFNTLFDLLKSETSMHSIYTIASSVEDILNHFAKDYLKDGNARDAAIDAVIEILQAQKTNHKGK